MNILKITIAFAAVASVTACASPAVHHSGQAVGHSANASAQGSAAVAHGAVSIAAVPVMATGAVLSVSGAALEQVGTGSVAAATTVLGPVSPSCQIPQSKTAPACVVPDAAPRLQ
jgi:hypothetical protein